MMSEEKKKRANQCLNLASSWQTQASVCISLKVLYYIPNLHRKPILLPLSTSHLIRWPRWYQNVFRRLNAFAREFQITCWIRFIFKSFSVRGNASAHVLSIIIDPARTLYTYHSGLDICCVTCVDVAGYTWLFYSWKQKGMVIETRSNGSSPTKLAREKK